jgi:hypothetical protein
MLCRLLFRPTAILRQKTGGRKKGSRNKRTVEKVRTAERELMAARAGKKLAVDHMDEMIDYFKSLVGLLAPWQPDGTPREDRDVNLWFRVVAVFQGFLSMRAPYQSPRLGAVTIVPSAGQPIMREIPPEDLDRRLAERGLPLSVFGMDRPVFELEAMTPGSGQVDGNRRSWRSWRTMTRSGASPCADGTAIITVLAQSAILTSPMRAPYQCSKTPASSAQRRCPKTSAARSASRTMTPMKTRTAPRARV